MNENTNTQIISGTVGGSHVVDGPLTVSAAGQASPDLLTSEIDSRVVRIRPMATPIDQISRMAGARPASSMKVEYYSVDTRPSSTTVKGTAKPIEPTSEGELPSMIVTAADDRIFAPTDTVLFPETSVETTAGQHESLICYVSEVLSGSESGLRLTALNLKPGLELPEISAGSRIVRMGRAAAELDVQTAQFEALPVKDMNFCQISRPR